MLPFRKHLLAILASGGAVSATPLTSFALVGDSLTQYGNLYLNLNTIVLTRTSNVVTFTKAGHGIFGTGTPVYLLNTTDSSFEGMYLATYVDANNLSLSGGPTGADGTTTGTANTGLTQQNRFARRGAWAWAQASKSGGLKFLGAYGQGGDMAENMSGATTQALALNPDAIILGAGINNVFAGSQSAATAWANIQARIDQINAGGKVAVCVSITPPTTAYASWSAAKMTAAQTVNASIQAYCAASPSNRIYVDAWTPLYDSGSNGAYSWATYDTLHWTTAAAKLVGEAVASAIAANTSAAPALLPVSASDTGTVNGAARFILRGPWVNTGGGLLGGGMTGSAPAGTAWTRTSTGTGVCSIVDPGDGKGFQAQCVFTPGAANEDLAYWPWTNSAPTLATLGLTSSDTIALAVEVEWSGAQSANLGRIELFIASQTSGLFGIASDGNDLESSAVRYPDSGTKVFYTGPVKLNASWTNVTAKVELRFVAASASALTLKVRCVCLFKL